MSKFTFTKPRATFEETLAFCNAVREAGGGNPLDALMPAVPQSSEECLLAKNFNFNCEVGYAPSSLSGIADGWAIHMYDDEETALRIGEALGLKTWTDLMPSTQRFTYIILPPEIGQVANDFDNWMEYTDALHSLIQDHGRDWETKPLNDGYESHAEMADDYGISDLEAAKALIAEFRPFVEASIQEVFQLGYINEKGELVL